MPSLKERAKRLVEIIDGARFLSADRPITLDERAAGILNPDARALLRGGAAELAAVEPWTPGSTERRVRGFADRHAGRPGAVARALRAALAGRTTSSGIFEVLTVLGKSESRGRLDDQSG